MTLWCLFDSNNFLLRCVEGDGNRDQDGNVLEQDGKERLFLAWLLALGFFAWLGYMQNGVWHDIQLDEN